MLAKIEAHVQISVCNAILHTYDFRTREMFAIYIFTTVPRTVNLVHTKFQCALIITFSNWKIIVMWQFSLSAFDLISRNCSFTNTCMYTISFFERFCRLRMRFLHSGLLVLSQKVAGSDHSHWSAIATISWKISRASLVPRLSTHSGKPGNEATPGQRAVSAAQIFHEVIAYHMYGINRLVQEEIEMAP